MLPVVYHARYQDYFFGPEHPFRPIRQLMVLSLLEALDQEPDLIEPPLATREEVLRVHSKALVEQVEDASKGTPHADARRYGLGTSDTPAFAGMDVAARYLAGGTLHAARLVASDEAGIVLQMGGGLHHAHHARSAGFCVYNDLAVAICHLTGRGLRVAYVDIDVHHGDGVQSIFYDATDVLTISLHESGRYLYPGTGGIDELGAGGGEGLKLNVPLQPGTADTSYLEAFERIVPHALSWFGPDALVVQCGADAHVQDPLAHLRLTTYAYERLFRRLKELAREYTDGRAVFTLGGGYALDATPRIWTLLYLTLAGLPLPDHLPEGWLAQWEERLGQRLTPTLHDAEEKVAEQDAVVAHNRSISKRLMGRAAKYWQ